MKHQNQFVPSTTLLVILREIVIYHPVNFNDIKKVLKYVNQQLEKMGSATMPDNQAYRLRKLILENNLEQDYQNCLQSDRRLNNHQAQEARTAQKRIYFNLDHPGHQPGRIR